MKQLGLMRHAKSDRDAKSLDDHSRPLAKRGIKAAERMGAFLAGAGIRPDLVLSSTAERAAETAKRVADAGNWEAAMVFSPPLYAADPPQIVQMMSELDDKWATAILVGHNPTFEDALALLVGGGNFRLPTGSVAWIQFPFETWKRCRPGSATLQWLVVPRLLDGERD